MISYCIKEFKVMPRIMKTNRFEALLTNLTEYLAKAWMLSVT